MRIGIIGLGLIGGSIAMALRAAPSDATRAASAKELNDGWHTAPVPAHVWAVDRDPATRAAALAEKLVDEAFAEVEDAPIGQTDLLLLCLHPEACLSLLRQIAPRLSPGTVVSDVCGIKRPIADCAWEALAGTGAHFVGGHPMAGKEKGGFANASPALFRGAHYLLCPLGAPESAVATLRELAMRIGCKDVILTDPDAHDANIAYTSQMMHVLALAICEQDAFERSHGFEGGSFRGATRVAALDAALWTQLFWENREPLAAVVGELSAKLAAYRALLDGDDRDALARRLSETSAKKEAADRAQQAD